MAIEFKCSCGAACSADEMKVGQTIHCEACGKDVKVPEPADAPVAEVLVDPGPSAMQGLQEIIGRGDVNEMVRQISEARGVPLPAKAPASAPSRVPASAPVGAAAAAGVTMAQRAGAAAAPVTGGAAPAAGVSVPGLSAAGPAAAEPESNRGFSLPPPPRGLDRARHHLGFKKVMWLPALIIGFGSVGWAARCFLEEGPTRQAMYVQERTLEIVKSADGKKMWLVPPGATATEHEDGTIWYTAEDSKEEVAAKHVLMGSDGHAWAIPQDGKDPHPVGGKMFYNDEFGYEVPAEPADQALKTLQDEDNFAEAKVRIVERYQKFGFGFSGVGVVLILLGFWMRHDVVLVRRATEPPPEEKGAKQEGEAAEPAEG